MRTSGRRPLLQRPVRAIDVVVTGVLVQDQSQVAFAAGLTRVPSPLAAESAIPGFAEAGREVGRVVALSRGTCMDCECHEWHYLDEIGEWFHSLAGRASHPKTVRQIIAAEPI
jgi:hypothetical protein